MSFQKHAVIILVAAVMTCLAVGCMGPAPLKLSYYSKNIIIKADKGIYVDGAKLDPRNLRAELVKHMIYEQTPVVLHVDYKVSREYYDSVLAKMRAEGYKHVAARVYKDQ